MLELLCCAVCYDAVSEAADQLHNRHKFQLAAAQKQPLTGASDGAHAGFALPVPMLTPWPAEAHEASAVEGWLPNLWMGAGSGHCHPDLLRSLRLLWVRIPFCSPPMRPTRLSDCAASVLRMPALHQGGSLHKSFWQHPHCVPCLVKMTCSNMKRCPQPKGRKEGVLLANQCCCNGSCTSVTSFASRSCVTA